MKEDRTIFILLPEGYDTIASLPVLYLPDPEWNLKHVFGTVQYLSTAQKIPPMIIVGIANTDRIRDLTPYATSEFKQGGGANNFLTFITKELAPYIEKYYKVSGKNILCGASLGGIFSFYTLLNGSNLFDAYFAISPSLWYAEGKILKDFEAFKGDFKVNKLLYITLANEKGMRVNQFIKQLRRKNIVGLKWKYERHLEETHSTIGHESVFDGLKWMFENK
ncbi:MAG TPA: alpha/beta hydrolase-fold protein [Cytophagaceae bacterium]